MKISNSGPVAGISPIASSAGQSVDSSKDAKAEGRGKPARRDSVEISDSGRALDARSKGPLTPERAHEIRARILNGSYDTVEVLGKVAQSILDRGDA